MAIYDEMAKSSGLSDAVGSISRVAEARRSEGVPAALDNLHDSLSHLENVLSSLQQKLGPITMPMPTDPSRKEGSDYAPGSSVRSGILEACARVQNLTRMASEVTASIDL